jgi:hypothetical protein
MLKESIKEINAGRRLIERTLKKKFPNVKASIDIFFHFGGDCVKEHPLISTAVTLWFSGSLAAKVKGSDDFKWLAQACVREATHQMIKIRGAAEGKPWSEISKELMALDKEEK